MPEPPPACNFHHQDGIRKPGISINFRLPSVWIKPRISQTLFRFGRGEHSLPGKMNNEWRCAQFLLNMGSFHCGAHVRLPENKKTNYASSADGVSFPPKTSRINMYIIILRQKWLFGRRSFPFCYVVTYKEGISRFHIRGPIQGRGPTLTYWWILSGLISGHKNTGAEKKQQLTTQSSITTKLGGCFLDIITVIFTPTLGEIMIPFEEHIFQMGCFNHQPMSKKFYAPNSCRVLDLAYDLPRWSP